MLTFCKRGENFCSGCWESMVTGGQVGWLPDLLLELSTRNGPLGAYLS